MLDIELDTSRFTTRYYKIPFERFMLVENLLKSCPCFSPFDEPANISKIKSYDRQC